MKDFDVDVAIIGSGPAGIAAATALLHAGIKDVVVYERESEIGGVPRYTHHPSFGLLVFKRPITGPSFIRKLLRLCPEVRFETNTTITAIRPGGELEIATPAGLHTVRARHIIMATGAREAPRHARLVSGLRPQGIITTGALQRFIYLAHMRPFERPIIVGTELVSFSALWTLHHAGIKPVAMIEEHKRITAYLPAVLLAWMMGVPVRYNTRISDIADIETLKQIIVDGSGGKSTTIACDGLIFSGCFVGENTIASASHLKLGPKNRIPLVDQNWVTSDANVSAIGNATHPADMGDLCYLEGLKAGVHVARLLAEKSTPADTFVRIGHGDGIKMTTPSILRPKPSGIFRFDLSFHVITAFRGTVRVSQGDQVLYEKTHHCLPARRITLRNLRLKTGAANSDLPIDVTLLKQK